jgi:monofunctional glycosyltransferase
MKKIKIFLKDLFKLFLKTILSLFVLSLLLVLIFKWVPVPYTPLMFIRFYDQHQADKPFKLEKKWKPLTEISPNLALAVVAAEDQLFIKHSGFDFESMQKAFEKNKKGKRIKGASTISQQTAKNVFLWPGRTYTRKALEAYFTVLIEALWGKERILEVYLNVIEMGDGIYGAEAASQHYFKTEAAKLSSAQSALIAAILPNPRKYSALRPSPYVQNRQQWNMKQMRNLVKLKFE